MTRVFSTHFASLVVLNVQKERYIPLINGYKKPIMKAARVGKTNIGKYARRGFSLFILFLSFIVDSPIPKGTDVSARPLN